MPGLVVADTSANPHGGEKKGKLIKRIKAARFLNLRKTWSEFIDYNELEESLIRNKYTTEKN